ncbi:MAG: 3-phosphoshikimate 1-carboxyvinyltransferase [Planctomycetes bacterium]|nr:3-phosphoshikimate 1-carboxyvinyltransferase [Planctomycetota bacterium]
MGRILVVRGLAPPPRGTARAPGDKSITHRALILGALANGETLVQEPLWSTDTGATERCLLALGARVARGAGEARVGGPLLPGGSEVPLLDCADSGTSARLLLGVLAGLGRAARLDGSASLRRRPMGRVVRPLVLAGARFAAGAGERLPLVIEAGGRLLGLEHRLPVASAQLKSALLLAGLFAEGTTRVSEPGPSRDHTERMLPLFGVPVARAENAAAVEGGRWLQPAVVPVPGDLSSALYLGLPALFLQGGDVTVEGVGVNPTRSGALEVLAAMGAAIGNAPCAPAADEPRADLRFLPAELSGVEVPAELFPRLLDDVPALAVAAARATRGRTVFLGAGELRHKESDRIAALADLLAAFGGEVEETEDSLTVHGGARLRPGRVQARGDHRIALAAGALALTLPGESVIEGFECVEQSFPDYVERMAALLGPQAGAVLEVKAA